MVEEAVIGSPSTIDTILRTEDIEGLAALGSPADEYSDEASAIQARLVKLHPDQWTSTHVSALVWDVWVGAFGPFLEDEVEKRQPVLQQVVRRILAEHPVSTLQAQAEAATDIHP